MAKKKKKEDEELEQQETSLLPKDWLYNPVVWSQISGDFTMLQQRILAGILDEMQDKILRSINDKDDSKRFPMLFSEEEMNGDSTTIEISPKKFGINPEHYDYLDEALKDLAYKRMGFPKAYKDKMNYVIAPLFARLELPVGERRRTGKVKVVMLNENLRDFLSMDKGYTEYLSRITQISKKVRTPRIYTFLASFKDAGHKKVDYKDFCKFLGIDDETARNDRLNKINDQLNNKEITQKEANERLEALAKWENPFRKWNKVKSQIIDPAKAELDLFSNNNQIDITFEYEALYEGDKKRGNPSHIQFTIIKKRLALEHDEQKALRRKRHSWVYTMCDWCRDFNTFDLRELVARVEDAELQLFIDYCYNDVRKAVERKQPDNVAAYALTMMERYVKELEHQRQVDKGAAYEAVDMFEGTDGEGTGGDAPATTAATVMEPDYDHGAGSAEWEKLVTNYDGELADLLRRTTYLGLWAGMFYVQMSAADAAIFKSHDDRIALQEHGSELLGLKPGRPSIYVKEV